MISDTVKVVTFGSVLIAIMAIISYLTFLWYPSDKFESVWITVAESLIIVIVGAAILLRGKYFKEVDLKFITIPVTFGLLLYAEQWLTMYAPAFVWYTPPMSWFATALLIYLPEGIIIAALVALVDRPGSMLIAMVPFYIVSMISYFNPIWTPFYFAWALAGDITLAIGGTSIRAKAIGTAFSMAVADTFLASQYLLFNFGAYTPPAIVVLTGVENATFALIGAAVGYSIGVKARKAWKP